MLAWTIYLSFIGVAVLMALPRGNARAARTVAMLAAVGGFLVALTGVLQAKAGPEIEPIIKAPWVSALRCVSVVCVLRTGDHSEVFPDRDLGFDAQGVRRDEAGAVFVRGQRDG